MATATEDDRRGLELWVAATEDDRRGLELWVAAQEGRADDVAVLLPELRVCARRTPRWMEMAAEVAAYNDHADAVRTIVRQCPHTLEKAMHRAAEGGSLRAIEALVPFTANRPATLRRALCVACNGGETAAARLLLSASVEVDDTAFHSSPILQDAISSACCVETIQLLLSAKAAVNASGVHTNVYLAALARRADVVQALVDAKAEVDKRGTVYGLSPLSAATLDGALDVMQVLVDAKADVDMTSDTRGYTPAVLAIGHTPAACGALRLLVSAKADVNKAATYGETPVQRATSRNAVEALRILVRAKADVGPKIRASSTYAQALAGDHADE
jgi:ankyrin repeat protein